MQDAPQIEKEFVAKIIGPKEQFAPLRSNVTIKCLIIPMTSSRGSKRLPRHWNQLIADAVYWKHNDRLVQSKVNFFLAR